MKKIIFSMFTVLFLSINLNANSNDTKEKNSVEKSDYEVLREFFLHDRNNLVTMLNDFLRDKNNMNDKHIKGFENILESNKQLSPNNQRLKERKRIMNQYRDCIVLVNKGNSLITDSIYKCDVLFGIYYE